MGCCGSIPGSSNEGHQINSCYVWGTLINAHPIEPLDQSLDIGRPLPAVVPGAPLQPRYDRLPAYELSLQWPPSQLKVVPSDAKHQWSASHAKWISSMFTRDIPSFACGREQLVFVGLLPLAKDTRCCLLTSTGWLLLLRKPKVGITARGYAPGWLEAHHVLHMRKIRIVAGGKDSGAAPTSQCTFEAEGGDANLQQSPAPLSGPEDKQGGGPIVRTHEQPCSFGLTTEQAVALVKAIRSLAMAFRGPPLEIDVAAAPADFTLALPLLLPMPADGGFCALFFAYCACLCVPLSKVSIGAELLAALPMLELDISGLKCLLLGNPFSPQAAYAAKVAMLRTGQFSGLRLTAAPGTLAFDQLCGIFSAGRLLKLELQGLTAEMLEKMCAALREPKANTIADMNLNNGSFGSTVGAVGKLAVVVGRVRGGLRRLSLSKCLLTKVTAVPLLQAIANKATKLEVLNLSYNDLKDLPHNTLTGIWKSSRIEVLDLTRTNVDFAGIAVVPTDQEPRQKTGKFLSMGTWMSGRGAEPGFKLSSLRQLRLGHTAPVPAGFSFSNPLGESLSKFFSSLGAGIELIEVAGALPTKEAVKAFVEAVLRSRPRRLTLDLRGVPQAIPGLALLGKSGHLPGERILLDIPLSKDAAVAEYDKAENHIATKWAAAILEAEHQKSQSTSSQMKVTVPAGVKPGAQLRVQAPNNREMTVTVPPRLRPGQSFQVQVPPVVSAVPAGRQPKSPADMQKEIAAEMLAFVASSEAMRREYAAAGSAAASVAKMTVCPPPFQSSADVAFPIVGGDVFVTQKAKVGGVGCGPKTALVVAGCQESKEVRELDITMCGGGDTTAVVLGALVLRSNRSLRSVKVAGNYFSVNGLAAIRGALYGNRRLLELPFPEADAELRIAALKQQMQACETSVVQCRAEIKRAFKRTRGSRTPQVVQVLNKEVENIKEHKIRASKFRYQLSRYSKVQQEIQAALHRNQQDEKNATQQQKEKTRQEARAYREADRALEKAASLEVQKKQELEAATAKMWKERGALLGIWTQRVLALRKAKRDTSWFETWAQSASRRGEAAQRPILTAATAELLLLLLPDKLRPQCKIEIKRTEQLMQNEADLMAEQEVLSSKVQEQKLLAAKVLGTAGITKPSPTYLVKASDLAPLKGTVVAPPPKLVQAPLGVVPAVVVGVPGGGAAAAAAHATTVGDAAPEHGGLVQGTVVPPGAAIAAAAYRPGQLAPGVVVGKVVTPAAQAARYEQFRVYQAQQEQAQERYRQQQRRDRSGGFADDDGLGFAGAYLYSSWWWHHNTATYGWHDYDSFDHDGGVRGVESPEAPEEASGANPGDVQLADGGAGGAGAEWGNDLPVQEPESSGGGGSGGGDGGDGIDLADVEAYAGGEDDRPGGGPPFGGSSAARAWDREPIPARLDLAEWFEERILKAELEAREAALGRVGPLPCVADVLLRTHRSHLDNEGAGAARICLVTQCSLDRLPQLEAQLEAWDGEVSVAVYVDGPPVGLQAAEGRRSVVEACARAAAARTAASPEKPPPVWTVTVVYRLADEEVRCPSYDLLYPVNTLRNAALRAARAALVFLVDVDFVPSEGLHGRLASAGKALAAGLRRGGPGGRPVALVVPAFEATQKRGAAAPPLPRTAESLRSAYDAGRVEGFHIRRFPKGHRATDFGRWFAGPEQGEGRCDGGLSAARHGIDAYPIEYEEHFEPYVVAFRDAVPAYDERFRGYGMNKIAHLYCMAKRGFSFCVVDSQDAFVVAGQHQRSHSWRVMYGPDADCEHRARLATHFTQFKAEIKAEELRRLEAQKRPELAEPEPAQATQAGTQIKESGADTASAAAAAGCIVVATTAAVLAQELGKLLEQLAGVADAATLPVAAPIVA